MFVIIKNFTERLIFHGLSFGNLIFSGFQLGGLLGGGKGGILFLFSSGVSLVRSRWVLFITIILITLKPFFDSYGPQGVNFCFISVHYRLISYYILLKYSRIAPLFCHFSPLPPPTLCTKFRHFRAAVSRFTLGRRVPALHQQTPYFKDVYFQYWIRRYPFNFSIPLLFLAP